MSELTERPQSPQMDLRLSELRLANLRRGAEWNPHRRLSNEFSFIELAGECGEVMDAAKKIIRHEAGVAGGDGDIEKLADELGDLIIAADLCAAKMGIDLSEAIATKFNKTSEKHGFHERLIAKYL